MDRAFARIRDLQRIVVGVHLFQPGEIAAAAHARPARDDMGIALGKDDDVAFAAAQNGWALVPGIVSDFQTHGYCANAHWIVNYSESPNTQNDQNGTLHPNTNGTADYAVRIRQGATASGILPA